MTLLVLSAGTRAPKECANSSEPSEGTISMNSLTKMLRIAAKLAFDLLTNPF
jgi:hypothetical protein